MTMLKSDIYATGEREVAMEEALDVLDQVFRTEYVETVTPVTYTRQEGHWWEFEWEKRGVEHAVRLNLWSGKWQVQRKENGEWKSIIEHT